MAQTGLMGGAFTVKPNGERLQALRKTRTKMKQPELEDALGIPHGQLTRIETGKPSSIKYILKLAAHFDTTPAEITDPEGLVNTKDVLVDLATLHGVKIDFGGNGKLPRCDCGREVTERDGCVGCSQHPLDCACLPEAGGVHLEA